MKKKLVELKDKFTTNLEKVGKPKDRQNKIINKLQESIKNLEEMKNILAEGIKDFKETREGIIKRKISIPKIFKQLAEKLFQINKPLKTITQSKTPSEVDAWLSENLNSDNEKDQDQENEDQTDYEDYDSLLDYLKEKHKLIKENISKLLYQQLEFSVRLEEFALLHKRKSTEPLEKLLKDTFGISASYSRKLRWIGRVATKYKRFKCLSLPIQKILRNQAAIKHMLQDENIANKWESDTPPSNKPPPNKPPSNKPPSNKPGPSTPPSNIPPLNKRHPTSSPDESSKSREDEFLQQNKEQYEEDTDDDYEDDSEGLQLHRDITNQIYKTGISQELDKKDLSNNK